MTQVLVFDLGMVLLPFDFSARFELLARALDPGRKRLTPTAVEQTAWDIFKELEMDIGGATGDQFQAAIEKALRASVSRAEFVRIWSHQFLRASDTVSLAARADVPLKVLLSNTDPVHWEWITTHHSDAVAPLAHLYTSFELGARKPEEAIYRALEAKTGYPPEAHLLVDDLRENVEGARACGWDAIQFTRPVDLEREFTVRGLLSGAG